MTPFNCPNCGQSITPAFDALKMTCCVSCGTTLFLNDKGARAAGTQGLMHDVPMLFGMGSVVRFGRESINMMGHARYSYGRGFWDEFWGLSETGDPYWVSVDEGDVVVQVVLAEDRRPKLDRMSPGKRFEWNGIRYMVNETDKAECVALRGSFDEELQVGEIYRFSNATGEDGTLLSGEFWQGRQRWFHGEWFDPFDIQVELAA